MLHKDPDCFYYSVWCDGDKTVVNWANHGWFQGQLRQMNATFLCHFFCLPGKHRELQGAILVELKKKKKQMDASCGHHLKLTGYWPLVSRVEPSTLEGKTKIWRDAHSGWKFSNASIVLLLVCTNGGLLHKCHQGWVMAFLHTGITVTCSVTDAFLKVGA